MSQPQEKGRYLFFDPFLCWPALQADPVEKALIQRIVAEADDDLPRLIYADWLEERGDPRGAFIRLQCELDRWNNPGLLAERPRQPAAVLEARLQALWSAQRLHLAGPWKPPGVLVGLDDGPVRFCRGIPALYVPDQYRLTSIREREICLHRWKLNDSGVQALACCADLAQVTHLNLLGNRVRTAGLRTLAGSPHVRQLEFLDLRFNKIRAGGLKALVQSTQLPELKILMLDGNLLGQAGLRMLHRWMSLPKLEKLYLYNTGIGRDDLTGLRRSQRFQRITIYP